MSDKKVVSIYASKEIRDVLSKMAKEQGRSISGQALHLLRLTLIEMEAL
jgi:hypothetical protein